MNVCVLIDLGTCDSWYQSIILSNIKKQQQKSSEHCTGKVDEKLGTLYLNAFFCETWVFD